MARGSSSAPLTATFAVFVDTSLDTHLAMVVSPDDTVGDLKGKIMIEHALCFPNIGKITVQSMKVRRRGSLYHLSDTMPVKSAFIGTKGTWFLYMDALSASHQAEPTENVMNQSAGQTLEHRLLDMEPNANAPGICTARGPEKLMLPENCSKMLSLHNNISLPHAGNSDNHFVPDNVNANVPNPTFSSSKNLCNDHGLPPLEHEKRSNTDQLELEEPVHEVGAAVGSHLQSETGQTVDQMEKDGRDDDHDNIGLEADDNLVSITKEKSRKRSNASRNDKLLEMDDSFVEKKKHKKGKYNPSKESIEDLVANFGSCTHNNETSILENVHPETSTLHHDSSKDLTKDEKKNKKKRKKGPHPFDEDIASSTPESGPSDSLLNNADAVVSLERVTEESPQEAFINNHRKVDKESDTALFMDNVARNMTDGDSIEVGDTDPLSTKLKGSNCDTETLLKIRLSSHGSSKDYPIQEPFTVVDPQVALGDNPTDLSKESDAAVPLQETATVRNLAEVDSDVPINSRRTKKSKNESSRTVSNKYSLLNSSEGHVNEENLEGSRNNKKDLSKESNFTTATEEVVDHENSVEGESEVPSNTNVKVSHSRRRKKSDKTGLFSHISSTNEPIHSSGDQVTEENPKETSGDHYTDPDKEPKGTTVIGDVAILGNPAVEDYSSQPNDRNSRRRRKKSAKAKLPNDDSIDKELVHSETIEENPKTLVDDEQGKESKFAIAVGETVVLGNTVVEDSKAPSSDRNSRRKRKKSTKAELPNHDLIDKEPVHSLVKEASEEKSKEILEDNHKEQGKESKLARVLGEDAMCGNPSVEGSTVFSNHNDRISCHRKKKSTQAKSLNHDFNDKGSVVSLVKKDTEDNLKDTLEDSLKEQGKESKLANYIGEVAACESPADVNLPIPIYTNDRSSRDRKRKKAKTESKYSLDHSSGNRCPEDNLEKALGTTHRVSGNESNAGTNPAENAQNLVHVNSSDVNPTVFPHDSSNKHNIANSFRKKVSGEHTEVTHENPEEETSQNETQKRVANDQMELPESDSNKVNFIEFFVPKVTQLEPHMSAQELCSLEAETKKSGKEKVKRKKKLNIHSEDTTNDMVNSSMLKDEPSKHVKGKISAVSDNNLKPIPYHEASNIMDVADENQQRKDLDAFMGSNPEAKSVAHSSACADAIIRETMADLAASSDSTEEDILSRQYRVAIRKVPSSRYQNNLNDTNQEKIMFATPGTIFNDTLSGSSEDEFERENIKATSKILSDNSSTSADSDRGHGQSHTVTSSKPHTYMNSPGIESADGENDEGIDGIILTQKSEVKKTKLLSKILRSTSSYRKAKLTASQSQAEDSESQPVDVVLESQPDSALP